VEKVLELLRIQDSVLFSVFLFCCSNDDHYKTSIRFSGVDMNAARLLFHKLIQPDHAHISQQVCAAYFPYVWDYLSALHLSRNNIVMLAVTLLITFFTQ